MMSLVLNFFRYAVNQKVYYRIIPTVQEIDPSTLGAVMPGQVPGMTM
jgi:hypothetical protein